MSRAKPHTGDDMTAAEVEALVAEQMKCLPPWFHDDFRNMRTRAERETRAARDRKKKSADEIADDDSAGNNESAF